jgi:hypothetical protein
MNSIKQQQNIAIQRYRKAKEERLRAQYLIDNFNIYGEYCALPANNASKVIKDFIAFHNWLVTHRKELKTVSLVIKSLQDGIKVFKAI